MPSGITAHIKDDTTFAEFALRCARAMGVCITMRDDPVDATIPKEFQPDAHYQSRLDDALSRQARLGEMTSDEAAQEIKQHNDSQAAALERRKIEDAATRFRYERMLALVEAWQPPSEDHANFKKFMLDQIRESINWDCCSDYSRYYVIFSGSPALWISKETEIAQESVERSRKYQQEEIERVAGRNKWLRELRQSLVGASA